MSNREGFGALTEVCWYQLLNTAYDPLRSGLLVSDSKHAPISSAAFSACHLDSTRRDLRTDLVILHSKFLLCHGLWRREALL